MIVTFKVPTDVIDHPHHRSDIITGLVKTESFSKFDEDVVVYRFFFNNEQNKENWLNMLPTDIKQYIV